MTYILSDITITIANLLYRILMISELEFTRNHTFIENRSKSDDDRINLWTCQRYNGINEKLYLVALKVLEDEDHHLK